MIYNKLVRDKIPRIISDDGRIAVTRVLSNDEFLTELDRKLNEECAEYQADKSLEELADMLEVIYAIAEARGFTIAELECVRAEKAKKRGVFKNKIFLERVDN